MWEHKGTVVCVMYILKFILDKFMLEIILIIILFLRETIFSSILLVESITFLIHK